MMSYSKKNVFRISVCLIVLLGFIFSGQAKDLIWPQDKTKSDGPVIQWLKQISVLGGNNSKSSLTGKLGQFIFGKTDLKLLRPISAITMNNGSLCILDQGKSALVFAENNLGNITQFKRTEAYPFISLVGLCQSNSGGIYFTDSKLGKVFYSNRQKKQPYALNETCPLNRPTGIAFLDQKNELWVVETNAHRISIFTMRGTLIKTIGQRGVATGEFNFPTFIWIDEAGMVYVVDSMNFRVQVFNGDGEVVSIFGENGDATGYFARPKGIATDSQGNIYVVDALFNTVQIFDKEGDFLFNFGEQGHGQGQFWLPVGIYIDPEDRIYVVDSYNARIQIFRYISGETDE